MTKQEFKKIIQSLILLRKDIGAVNSAFKELDPDFGGFYIGRLETMVLEVLKITMKDEKDWIGYWIYDLDTGKEYKKGSVKDENGKDVKLKTIDDLYKVLTTK